MSIRFRLMALAVIMLTTGILTGCGKEGGKVVAKVGNYDITTQEFNEMFVNYNGNFKTAREEFDFRRAFLDSLIIQRLLIQAGYEQNLDKSEQVLSAVQANADKFVLDILYETEIKNKAIVSDTDVKEYYDKLAEKRQISHILVKDLDTANALIKKLANGASFEQLAYDYSMDPNAKRSKGDLGYILWGGMASLPEFEEVAFKLPLGEVSPPVKSRFGYHVIKVTDIQPNEQRMDLEKNRPQLLKSLEGIKRTKRMIEYVQGIQQKYPITIDTTTTNYLVRRRIEMYPPDYLKNEYPKYEFDESQLDRNEKDLAIANWEGGQVKVVDYLTDMRKLPEGYRPSIDNVDSLKIVIFQIKLNDILVFEAKKAGFENGEEMKKKNNLFKELTMVDIMKNDSISKPQPPSDTVLLEYYNTHTQEFTEPARVHVYEIQLSDELLAKRLAVQLKTLDAFKQKAMEVSEREFSKAKGGDLNIIIRDWFPEIFDAAMMTNVGKVGGPVIASGKYSIFYVAEKINSSVKPFADVKQEIYIRMMTRDATNLFVNWVRDKKQNTDITIDTTMIWNTIDQAKYSQQDSSQATQGK